MNFNNSLIYGLNKTALNILKKNRNSRIIEDDYNQFFHKIRKINIEKIKNKNKKIFITIKNPQNRAAYEYLKRKITTNNIFDVNGKKFKENIQSINVKNIYQNILNIKKDIKNFKIISFDFFETIVDRSISKPSDIYFFIGKKLKDEEYYNIRKKIDSDLENNTNFQYSFTDIRNQLIKLGKYSLKEINKRILLEKYYEKKFIFPRLEIVNLIKDIKKKKKILYLISDTHHSKKFIIFLLKKFKINLFDKIYISSEMNKSKKDGSVFLFLKNKRIYHMGDNIDSDYEIPKKIGIRSRHIENINTIILKSNFSKIYAFNNNLYCKILIGIFKKKISEIIFKNIFNSKKKNYITFELEDLGYVFFGPLSLVFGLFISKISQDNKIQKLLLMSREGYFIKKLIYILKKYIKFPDFNYFYTSRKVSTQSAIKNLENIVNIFSPHDFNGNLYDLFLERFSIKLRTSEKKKFIKIYNKKKQIEIMKIYKSKILAKSLILRNRYLEYIKNLIQNKKRIAFVDQGVFGTSQKNIERITNKIFFGIYVTYYKKNNKFNFSCFDFENSHFARNQIFFESLYTSPEGCFDFIDINNKKIFKKKQANQLLFSKKKKIFEGIKLFIFDFIKTCPSSLDNKILYEIFNNDEFKLLSDLTFGYLKINKKNISRDALNSFCHDNSFRGRKEKKLII
jgi:predicted HAD superfamily hydrolase